MDDSEFRDSLRPLARTIVDPDERRAQANVHAAFGGDGTLKRSALRPSLPPLMLTWYLPGAVTAGANVEREIPLAGDLRVTHLAMRAKTSPTTAPLIARLTANGTEVQQVAIQPGQASGVSSVYADTGRRVAGDVLQVDITSAGGAADVTITATYTVAD